MIAEGKGNMKRAKCPNCKSTALYVPCTVSAKVNYNSDIQSPFEVNKGNIDCYFLGSVTCKKCGWVGDESELK